MQTPPMLIWILLPSAAYLLGSIPWGLVITRWATPMDIRLQGSGNIGATNVYRTAGLGLGLCTLAADTLKGILPVYVACLFEEPMPEGPGLLAVVTALAAFWGHLYPIYLKLKAGGKGVATAAGCFLILAPGALLAVLSLFIGLLIIGRRVSVASLGAVAVLPVAVLWMDSNLMVAGCAVIVALFVFLRHRGNIHRLLNGTEPTI